MREKKAVTGRSKIKAVVWGIGAASGVIMLGIFICAVLIASGIMPEQWINSCTLILCFVAPLIGCRVIVKGQGRRGTPICMAIGAGSFLLLVTSGILIYGALDTTQFWLTGTVCLCGSGVAVLTLRQPKKRHA